MKPTISVPFDKLVVFLFTLTALSVSGCGGSGIGGSLSPDTASLTLFRTVNSTPPQTTQSTTDFTEARSDPAPQNYDPYLFADVDTVLADHMHITVRSGYSAGLWQKELDIYIPAIVAGDYVLGQGATVHYKDGAANHSFTGGTVSVLHVGGWGGGVTGTLDVTYTCSTCSPSETFRLTGSFDVTRAY